LPGKSRGERFYDEYLRLALLCGWYGFPEDSRHYVVLAITAQPGSASLLMQDGLTATHK